MSGRLIILPKKTWNVWNREAIAKVRNDEREHAVTQARAKDTQRHLDSEQRLGVLRGRAGLASGGDLQQPAAATEHVEHGGSPSGGKRKRAEGAQVGGEKKQGHINFFAEFEHALGGNAEQEKEMREKELLELKRSGIAPLPLGGTQNKLPWWTEAAPALRNVDDRPKEKAPSADLVEDAKGRSQDKEDKKHKKKHKKKKKRSKSKHGSREEESWDEGKRVAGCDEATMKQLRESRLRREAHEAHRTGSLLRHVPQGNGAGDVDKKRGYNGAFFLK